MDLHYLFEDSAGGICKDKWYYLLIWFNLFLLTSRLSFDIFMTILNLKILQERVYVDSSDQ